MPSAIKPLIAGNWKMNGTSDDLSQLLGIARGVSAYSGSADTLICVPATLVDRASQSTLKTSLKIGGQDCHHKTAGAHTGDISAPMLKDAGAQAVIVGHSERRTDHDETDEIVRSKASAAHDTGLVAVICVGETQQERENGQAEDIVSGQIQGSIPDTTDHQNTVVAYEPVWAIGTGLVPTNNDILSMHAHIRNELKTGFGNDGEKIRILYGGSLKPSNAAEILAISEVNGGLIGGASLKSADFLSICDAVGQ